jgi:D-lactate dehydrogenase (cytochrome)
MTPPRPVPVSDDVYARLERCLGPGRLVLDRAEREACSADVYSAGATCAAVLRPADRASAAAAVGIATRAGYAVIARGGGLTYTGGYTPPHERTFVVDLAALDRIVEIADEDMYVTAEAGVTWRQLYEALAPRGLRLPCFGTFSGRRATVGGGLSSGALFFGSARYGTVADSLLGLEIGLADGTVLRTGQAGLAGAKPFYRTGGPDLTGPFVHDGGTLGVKLAATFRLVRMPEATGHASFAFPDLEAAARALSEIARTGAAEDAYVFDPATTRKNLAAADLVQAARTLGGLLRGPQGWLKGLADGARLAAAGRSFGADDVYSLHVTCAARSAAALDADLAACRAAASAHGGAPLPDSIPLAVRSAPFPPLNAVLGPDGERWAALNAKVAHSDALALVHEAEALLARHAEEFARHGITISRLLIALSNHAFSYEPVFHWRDAWLPIHRSAAEPAHLAKLAEPPPDLAARELVHRVRAELVSLFAARGAASNQIGRTYRYRESLEPATARLLDALKDALDPDGRLNPGALGLHAAHDGP